MYPAREKTRTIRVAALTFFITLFLSISSYAGDISLHGFLQGNYALNTASSNPDGGEYKLAEERMQLKLEANREPLHIFLKTDVLTDHIDKEAEIELREGYIDFTSSNWDLRVGRQVITWGVGDLIFINDIFPKDYVAFFSGRPMEYLKKGVDAVKIGIYPSFVSAELVIIPFFESDVYPLYPHTADIYPARVHNGRFWVFDPRPATKEPRNHIEPTTNIENTELALRVYRNIYGFDTSLYFYRGFYKRPYLLPDRLPGPTELDYYHPELSVYGASLQGRALDGILSLEGGFYDSRQDRKGTEPQVPNQSTKFLIGYQRQIWEDFTAGLQYYMSYMLHYNEHVNNIDLRAPSCPYETRIQDLIALRLTHLFMHQTFRLSFFAFYSPSYEDYLLNPEIKYNFTDSIWAAAGANIFGGDKYAYSQFGQMDKNDNIYVQARYEF